MFILITYQLGKVALASGNLQKFFLDPPFEVGQSLTVGVHTKNKTLTLSFYNSNFNVPFLLDFHFKSPPYVNISCLPEGEQRSCKERYEDVPTLTAFGLNNITVSYKSKSAMLFKVNNEEEQSFGLSFNIGDNFQYIGTQLDESIEYVLRN
ncbi:unnamed protein product [Bursaphelenchus okinawaensis]|uniref:Uncharacterized protein n=1 Tax=Bursaphelenchus okinawaensis TaxID=465554 RepID=A0A811KN21_9BILA|nr:unnamed protein product [Bursaphelenchus okinawaensis]CAG9105987.1 unnamed protein product [Bursaphelenchus okinawaensis]